MNTGVVDRFTEIFTRYIDSGFGLLGGEVAFLASALIVIDVTLAGLFWAWGADEDVIARLVKKTLYVGFFAFLIGNFNGLAKIIFNSFTGLGLKAAGSSLSADQFLQPGRLAQVGIDAGKPILQAAGSLLGLSICGPGIATGLTAGAPQLGAGAAVGTALAAGGLGAAGAVGLRAGAAAVGRAAGAISPPRSGGASSGAAAPNSTSSPGGPPPWARRMRREQAISHGVSAAAHPVRSGDHGGGSTSDDLKGDQWCSADHPSAKAARLPRRRPFRKQPSTGTSALA